MLKILKNLFHKDLWLVLITPLFTDLYLLLFLYLLAMVVPDNYSRVFWTIGFFVAIFLTFRLTILPYVYDNILQKSQNNIAKWVILTLKKSIISQILFIIILIFAINYFYINVIDYPCDIETISFVTTYSLISGILGSFLVLFIYWFLRDKFNEEHIISKILNKIINKYTCIFSIICIIFAYLLIFIYLFKIEDMQKFWDLFYII